LIIVALVKTRERFMGIGQVLTMPLFFVSNAIYPIDIMPPWLRVCAKVNPQSILPVGKKRREPVTWTETTCTSFLHVARAPAGKGDTSLDAFR
jgi:ABC-type polysaccharide/polyol phosphate export permease